MCMQAPCDVCQKATWRGCGQHVPKVMDSIPADQWCTCGPKTKVGETEYPPQKGQAQK